MSDRILKWIIIILLIILIITIAGVFILTSNVLSLNNKTSFTPNSATEQFAIFDSVNASVNGKITKLTEEKIFFENQKGIKGEATIQDDVMISDPTEREPLPPSIDRKRIKLNRPVSMIFKIANGQYYVTAITFTP